MSSWHIRWSDSGHDRNGFQNRDSGRTGINRADFGPDFGVDYARFADEPDVGRDQKLQEDLLLELRSRYPDLSELELKVKNGFVIVKGSPESEEQKIALFQSIRTHKGVREIISEMRTAHSSTPEERPEDSEILENRYHRLQTGSPDGARPPF